MTWQEQYQTGSFRGAEFVTRSSDASTGRRIAIHDFPDRDRPYLEDMGRQTRRFGLQLFTIGDDYMEKRDALLNALEAEGPGTLVHPYYGTMKVSVLDVRVRETTRRGGMADFYVYFAESGEADFPEVTKNQLDVINDRADDALATIQDEFGDTFDVEDTPDFVGSSATNIIQDIADKVRSVINAFPTIPAEVTSLFNDIDNLSTTLTDLIRTPGDLADEIIGMILGVRYLFQSPVAAFKTYERFFNYGGSYDHGITYAPLAPPPSSTAVTTQLPAPLTVLPPVARTTPIRTKQSDNQTALIKLVQRATLIQAVRVAAEISFQSYNAAVSVRDELVELLDVQMLTADDEVFIALSDLRAAIVQDITVRGADLARIVTYRPPATLPALVIAYRLYGEVSPEAEIISRNHIRHPGFTPGGMPLEVLTHA